MWEGVRKQTNSALLDIQPKIFPRNILKVHADIDDVILVKQTPKKEQEACCSPAAENLLQPPRDQAESCSIGEPAKHLSVK